jgi:predicted amidohydrolase YtcJ
MPFGSGDAGLSIGAIKVMLNETGDRVLPAQEELDERVYAAHAAGFQVAFHAAEERGALASLSAVESAIRRAAHEAHDISSLGMRVHDHRHRIEHCGVCPPVLAARIAKAGMLVVTQPAFIAEHGERYQAQMPPESWAWLYPIKSLQTAGVRVAFGSDCPVIPPEPLRGIAAAVTRRAANGQVVGAKEGIAMEQAVAAYTRAGAYAGVDEALTGGIAPDMQADLVLLSEDISRIPAERLAEVRVEKTVLGGQVVWER